MALSVSKTFQFKPYEHLLCGTKELTTPKGKTYYLTVVMEVYSRFIVSYDLSKTQSDASVIKALKIAEECIVNRAIPHVTDKSFVHFTQRGAAKNQAYIDYVERSSRFLMPVEAFKNKNVMAAFWRRFTEDFVERFYRHLTSYKVLDDYIYTYCQYNNDERPHEPLFGLTPRQFLEGALMRYADSR